MMFMPQRPYLPLGTMRAAIAYQDPPDAFATAEVEAVVKRVGLTEFLGALDVEGRLDKSLSLGQQQLIGFARLLLHTPAWVFLAEATSALRTEARRVGKECVSAFRSRWSLYHSTNKQTTINIE